MAGAIGDLAATGDVRVIGEALVDIVERDGAPSETHPGGSPLNVAVGLARLGAPVTLHTLLGEDAHGDAVRAHLDASGVRLAPGSTGAGTTWTATAHLDETGAASYVFAMDGEIPVGDLGHPRLVHVGSIGALREPGSTGVLAALRALPGDVLRTFDPNIRADVLGAPEAVRARVAELAAVCGVVKLSDEDAEYLFSGDGIDAVLERIAALGPRVVVVTRGSEGSAALVDGIRIDTPSLPVVVADTIGAGDAFMSGLLAGLLGTGADRALVERREIPADDVRMVLATARASAALTVATPGANPPGRERLEATIKESTAARPAAADDGLIG